MPYGLGLALHDGDEGASPFYSRSCHPHPHTHSRPMSSLAHIGVDSVDPTPLRDDVKAVRTEDTCHGFVAPLELRVDRKDDLVGGNANC